MWSLRTDGADDFLASTQTLDVNQPWYFAARVAVEQPGGVADDVRPLFGLFASDNTKLAIALRSNGSLRRISMMHRSGGGTLTATTATDADYEYGVPLTVEGWADGSHLYCSINGGAPRSVAYSPSGTAALAPLRLGAGNGIAATRYYDWLAVQRTLSDAERAALRTRWIAEYMS
jgi:hypothetical protein